MTSESRAGLCLAALAVLVSLASWLMPFQPAGTSPVVASAARGTDTDKPAIVKTATVDDVPAYAPASSTIGQPNTAKLEPYPALPPSDVTTSTTTNITQTAPEPELPRPVVPLVSDTSKPAVPQDSISDKREQEPTLTKTSKDTSLEKPTEVPPDRPAEDPVSFQDAGSQEDDREPRSVRVPASSDWISADLRVENGDEIEVTATGKAITAPNGTGSGPEGQRYDCDVATCVAQRLPYGALLGRIGTGRPFFIGSSQKVRASAAGDLYFMINDKRGFSFDNLGSYTVTVVIARR
jgi:hypothetical protein